MLRCDIDCIARRVFYLFVLFYIVFSLFRRSGTFVLPRCTQYLCAVALRFPCVAIVFNIFPSRTPRPRSRNVLI
jgi:hypothetical protein